MKARQGNLYKRLARLYPDQLRRAILEALQGKPAQVLDGEKVYKVVTKG